MASTSIALQPDSRELGSVFLPADAWLYLRGSLRLSDIELVIVQEIFAGQLQESITSVRSISPEIVYRTLQRIYIKLHIGSRAELKARIMAEYLAYATSQSQRTMVASSGAC